jgi:hypothetical protein
MPEKLRLAKDKIHIEIHPKKVNSVTWEEGRSNSTYTFCKKVIY